MPIQRRRQFLTNGTFARTAGLSGFGASGKSRAAALQTRRGFLRTAAFAGVAGMLPPLGARAAEPGPETTTISLPIAPAICTMPQMITRQLLQAEGFTDIRFVDEPKAPVNAAEQLARGEVDLMVAYASSFLVALDKGAATTLLAVCMAAASCCSALKTFTASPVSRGRPSGCRGSDPAPIC